jgi:hypothetical protein
LEENSMSDPNLENGQQLYYLEPNTGQYRIYDQREKYDIDIPVFVKKSNMLIKRVGSTTLMSEKILLAAIATANMRKKKDYEGTEEGLYLAELKKDGDNDFSDGLVSEFRTSELKSMLKIKTSRYYDQLDEYMNNQLFQESWTIMSTVKNSDKDAKHQVHCIIGTTYDRKNGRVFIKWNPDLAEKILCSKGNGTMLSLDLMADFKDLQSFNMYQLLKEEISYAEYLQTKVRKQEPLAEYCVEFNLAELKFLISINQVSFKDPREKETRDLIRDGRWEDAEKSLKKASQTDIGGRMYDNWYNFRRKTLASASLAINGFKESFYKHGDKEFDELCDQNHTTDIHYRTEMVKRGQAVCGLRFFVRWDKKFDYRSKGEIVEPTVEEKKADEERHHERFRLDISEIAGIELTYDDINALMDAAGNDIHRVEAACAYMRNYGSEIENIVGFLIDAIRKGYSAPVSKAHEEIYAYGNICEKFNNGGKLIEEQGMPQEAVDLVMNILYKKLNSREDPMKIGRSVKPAVLVKDRLLNLTSEEIGFVYKKLEDKQKTGSKITENYIVTLLYNAHEEYIIAQLNEKYEKNTSREEKKTKNQFQDYEQREYSDDQMKEFELRKLGVKKKK